MILESLGHDVRYGWRHLRRSPGFAAAAILTLALGIGANTAMLTMLNALMIERLPIPDPDGLIAVSGRNERGQPRSIPISAVDELARDGPLLPVCGYNDALYLAVEANKTPTQASVALVTGGCFATFGVRPILGRPITEEDAPIHAPGNRVAVITHRFWTRTFAADPEVLGNTIRTEGIELTIIGVLPPGFGGLQVDAGADMFVPNDTVIPARTDRRPFASHFLGRLRPGVSLEQARARLEANWPAVLAAAVPATLAPAERAELLAARLHVERMGTGLSGYRTRYGRALILILGLTSLLLLLACVNLGGLLLARLSARTSELSVRLALGGSRRRIAQQMLVESLLLSFGGAALAIPISLAIVAPLTSFLPEGWVERTVTFTPDVSVLAVTALAGVAVGVLMSTLPIWAALHRDPGARTMSTRTIAGTTGPWVRALLVAQVSLSVILLISAGLLVRSLYLLQQAGLGVRTERVLHARLMPVPGGYNGLDASYYPALLDQLASLPGIRAVGLSRSFPRGVTEATARPIALVGDEGAGISGHLEGTSPGFFEMLGMPLLAGRLTSWSDNADTLPVAVVSESLARALAPDGDVLGRRVRFGSQARHQNVVIVGIVGDATRGNPREVHLPVFYRPLLQDGPPVPNPNVVLSIERDAATVADGIRRVVQRTGRAYVHEVISLDDLFARAPASERMSAALGGAVGGLSVVLVLVGVYGALAYSVSRRTREIGVRMAVGAAPGRASWMVLREALVVTLAGLAIGLPLAVAAGRALRTLMFGVSEADLITLAASTTLFVAVGLAAGVLPAWRAARIDPAIALRAD